MTILVTITVFGTWKGVVYSLVGTEASALSVFAVGHWLGKDLVKSIIGSRTNRISRTIVSRGIVTVITLRILPIAPFSVINVIAGISDISWRDFAIGNFIGILPGVLATAFLADRLIASIRHPDWASVLSLLFAVALITFGLVKLRKWMRKKATGKRKTSADE